MDVKTYLKIMSAHTSELWTINGFSTGTVVLCEISTLDHELVFFFFLRKKDK